MKNLIIKDSIYHKRQDETTQLGGFDPGQMSSYNKMNPKDSIALRVDWVIHFLP